MDFSSYERLIITKYVGAQIEYPKMAISILSYWYLVLLVLFGLIETRGAHPAGPQHIDTSAGSPEI